MMRQCCSGSSPWTVHQRSFSLDLVLNDADTEGGLQSDGEGRFGRLDGHRTLQSSWLSRRASHTACSQICLSFLFLSLLVSPTAAVVTIEAANSPQQCGTTTLKIDGQAPPFDISVHILTQGTYRGTVESFSASSNPVSWLTDVAAGTRIQFELSSERRVLSQLLTVEQSDDDTCIGGTATPTSTPNSDPATSTSETPPSNPNPTPPHATTASTQPPDVPSPTSTPSNTSGQQTSDGDHDTSSATTDVPSPSQTGGSPGSSVTASGGSDPSAGGSGTSLSSGHATAGASGDLPRGTSATDSSASASASASVTPTSQASPGHTSHLALIAGIIAAVVAIICIVVGALYWRYKRRKTARFAIEQFPAPAVKDLEDRPQAASSHPMAMLPTSSKAGMWHSSRSSLLSASSGRGTLSELPSESTASSVLDIHPHALESVIGQGPTTTAPTLHRESHRILPESFPISKGGEKNNVASSRSPENTRSLNDALSHRSQAYDVQSLQSYRTYDTPDAAARTPSEPISAVSEHVVYELDGGVRVAGGPPGREGDARQTFDTRAMALTLPPPYQVY